MKEELKNLLEHYNAGLKLYREKKFPEAMDYFKKALEIKSDDGPSKLYIERCEMLIKNPPPADWDGGIYNDDQIIELPMNTIKHYQDDYPNICNLNEDTDFFGTLKFKNPIQISGKYKGDIIADSVLIISEKAHVKANVKVNILVLAGTLHGEVEAREKVDILPTGKLYGNITTAKLKIADGVIFDGTCKMIKT